MDFSKLLHEFSMLLHGFVKLVTCFSRPLPTKTKQMLDQRLKKLNRVYDLGLLRLWQCLYLFVISNRNETNTTLHQHLSTLQRTVAIFMEIIQSANPRKSGKRICLTSSKMKYRVLFSNHMKAMAVRKRKEDFKVWFPPTHPSCQLKKQSLTKPTHPCSPRQVLLSRSTSPPWLDPRQTSSTVVPRQLFLTGRQKWGCRLQRQRWCQQQGGGRRQRQWWQLGLRHKWWFKIFQFLEICLCLFNCWSLLCLFMFQ